MYVEARPPHGADKDQPEWIGGILELLIQVLGHHPPAVRHDVQALLPEFLDFPLFLGDDDGHVGLFHKGNLGFQGSLLLQRRSSELDLQVLKGTPPVFLNLVVHPHGGELVNGDDHGLAQVAPVDKVLYNILSDLFQAVVAGDEVVLAGELARQQRLLSVV